jgi:hypothetical protein
MGFYQNLMGVAGHPILSQGARILCVHRDKTNYQTKTGNPLPINCAAVTVPNDVGGPYIPLASALYFQPQAGTYNQIYGWSGGDYYLDIAPDGTSRDVHASLGSADGTTPTPSASLCGGVPCVDRLLNGLHKDPEEIRRLAEEEARQRKAREEADYARRFQADVARDDANTRSLADYAADWMGKALIVTGTVSRVELQLFWAVLHFQERPSGDFVVCFGRKLFEGFHGPDFSGLVGKTISVRGPVTRPVCSPRGAGMQITVPSQITVR